MFDKQCLRGDKTIERCTTSKSKHNLWYDILKKFKSIFCLTQAEMFHEKCF